MMAMRHIPHGGLSLDHLPRSSPRFSPHFVAPLGKEQGGVVLITMPLNAICRLIGLRR